MCNICHLAALASSSFEANYELRFPDRNNGATMATLYFQEIKEAYWD